jgi:polyhydroxybutyrate depolymerase
MVRLALLSLLGLGAVPALASCGASPAPCTVQERAYHAALPAGPARGAVVFLHGHGGSGELALENAGMVQPLVDRGYAVVAPDGQPRAGTDRRSWAFRPPPDGTRDDVAFLRAVADDAATRFGLPRERMVLAGFSVGGSMVAYAACRDPGAFAAFAPVAGNFWRPYPAACAGPVRMLHVHGWADGTVPLEGRRLRAGIEQGDAFAAMEIWRKTNLCTRNNPDSTSADGPLMRRVWSSCAPGSALQFVLHPGGHMVPQGWAGLMLDWFEAP